ncbi:MAG: hypothetical protein P8Y60_18420, partial [Calditrichota bacterium]
MKVREEEGGPHISIQFLSNPFSPYIMAAITLIFNYPLFPGRLHKGIIIGTSKISTITLIINNSTSIST